MTSRARLVAFAVVCLLAVAGVVAYVAVGRERPPAASGAPARASASVAEVEAGPHLIFRDTTLGPSYGHVALAALGAPDGARAVTPMTCDRVDRRAGRTLCLSSRPGVSAASTVVVTAADGAVLRRRNLPGTPSRARLSPDGTLVATTTFVAGDSYLDAGFSTRTYVVAVDTGRVVHLEDLALVHEGRRIRPVDRNLWGVTFLDGDAFYVTVAFGGRPWLARGSLSAGTLTTVRADAECPSLSPDGTRVAYKKRLTSGGWSVAVLDLASGQERWLPEQRSVDDQVSWLDDDTVVYGLPLTGERGGETDLYAVPADGSAAPRLLAGQAWSPSVVR